MNKKQGLAMKYQETKIKPNKITVSFAFNAIDNFGYFVLFALSVKNMLTLCGGVFSSFL